MLKKHLAVMLMFILAAGVFSQSIPSGIGRYSALGNSPFVLDASTDIFNNPAWNNYYRDYAFGDLNQFGESSNFNGNAGVTFGVGKKWNLGMIINKRQDEWSRFNLDTIRPSNSPQFPFMGLIGTSLNKGFHIALAPYYSAGKYKVTDTNGNAVSNLTSSSMGANLGMIYMIKKGWIEGNIYFRMNKFENEYTATGISVLSNNDGGIALGVNLRAWVYPSKSSKIAVVPLLGFYTYSFQPKSEVSSGGITTTQSGLNYSWMNINGGVGLNWPIMDDIQIAGGVTLAYNTSKSDSGSSEWKSTDFVAPAFNMALETRISDWITARLGFNKSFIMRTREGDPVPTGFGYITEENSYTEGGDNISLGAGFHFGRFSIDATVSERWLKQGPYLFSGSNAGNSEDLFGVISASYNFGK